MEWLTTLPSKYTLALATAVTFLNSVGADIGRRFPEEAAGMQVPA
jgi:hypothetical protein